MCSQRRKPEVPEEIRRAADLLERRWALRVLYACESGAIRFNDFTSACHGIPPGTLAARLAELEDAGVLERRVSPETRPPRVEYRLTERGEELRALLSALRRFAGP
jgi:DNA-binding HxlR family transcriptional regulator